MIIEFMFDGHDYTYDCDGDNKMERITVRDQDGFVGVVTLNHEWESAYVERDDMSVSNVNYFDFNAMDRLEIAKWIAGTSY